MVEYELPYLMVKMGNVLVDPHANYLNKCRFCLLQDTSHIRDRWLNMNFPRIKRLCCKLKWPTYATHCFKYSKWERFMAECHHHVKSS